MVYWIVVGTVWVISVALLMGSGMLFYELLEKGFSLNEFLAASGLFILGLVLNFIVVNWPIESGGSKKLDDKTLKLLKYLAKAAPIAPNVVKVELEKLVRKYGD